MTTASYVLILAVLILGGIIATVGDRIGTRVGKARLSLFKLRPRKTATLITILTGTVISASTFGILIAGSEQLRKAIFDFETIQRNVRRTRAELEQANQQKAQVQGELSKVNNELKQVGSDRARANQQLAEAEQQLTTTQKRLAETNNSLESALTERSRAQTEAARIDAELSQTRTQLNTVSQQTGRLRSEVAQLQADRNQVIEQRNQILAQRDQAIAQRNQVIAQRDEEIRARDEVILQREARLRELEGQQAFLAREVQKLEQEAQGLRKGDVAIQRGQILAAATVRIDNPANVRVAIDQLLREANRRATQLIRPGTTDFNAQIVQITNLEVDQLMNQIGDGKEYVVRISAAANYLIGETAIQVFSNAVPNQVVFAAGDVVAATSLDPSNLSEQQIQQRINLLIAAANFRANSLGILTDSVEVGRIQNVIAFVEQLKQVKVMVELKAIAAETTSTAGPLKIELVAAQDGQVLFRTKEGLEPSAGNRRLNSTGTIAPEKSQE